MVYVTIADFGYPVYATCFTCSQRPFNYLIFQSFGGVVLVIIWQLLFSNNLLEVVYCKTNCLHVSLWQYKHPFYRSYILLIVYRLVDVVVMLAWQLDLQLHMQSLSTTTKVMSWNPLMARFT